MQAEEQNDRHVETTCLRITTQVDFRALEGVYHTFEWQSKQAKGSACYIMCMVACFLTTREK